MAGEYLPPITQEFRGDASGLLKTIAEVDAAYEGLGKQSHKTSEGIGRDEKDSEKAIGDFDRLLRDKLKKDETALQGIQREFTEAQKKVEGLRAELQRSSGGASTGLYQDLKHAENELKQLEHLGEEILPGFKKHMSDAGHKGGKALTDSIGEELMAGLSDLPIMPAIIGGLVAASPMLIGLLGSAVAAAVGTVGVVGGVVGAAHDPRVKSAFVSLGHEAMNIFSQATAVFVGPVLDGLHDIENMLAHWAPTLRGIFDALANVARPLIDGFGGFIFQMLPGLEEGFRNVEPLLEDLAKLLPWLGAQFGYMFKQIMSGGAGGRLALQALIGDLGGIVVGIGNIINWSERMFLDLEEGMHTALTVAAGVVESLSDIATFLHLPGSGALKDLTKNLERSRDAMQANITAAQQQSTALNGTTVANENAANATNSLGRAISITTDDMEALVKAQDDWIGKTQSVDDALLTMHQGISNFNKELHRGKAAWDLNRQAGQQNQAALNSAVHGVTAYYDALKALHPLNQQQARDELDSLTRLYDQAKAAGASATNLGGLADQIKLLKQRLDELNHTTVSFSVHGILTGSHVDTASHTIRSAFAQGGIVPAAQGLVSGVLPPRNPGTLVLAGERGTGGEVFMPLRGINPARAMSLAQVAGNAYGFDAVPRGRSYGYAGSGGVQTVVIPVYVGGKYITTVHADLMQYSQRFKVRTGSTGLT